MVICLNPLLRACLSAISSNWAIRGKQQAKAAYYLDRENLHAGTIVRVAGKD